eukprot:TRINITY_DN28386_c0_g1_i1.p1 TRINITY_DN28386_c0_g1~~TRINITY_DN28386_c0_g1_i1.p1  ORF type:complete len:478 (-),score=46.04 TRINITY_DN28386_c0_g1_i1:1133-2536(-)
MVVSVIVVGAGSRGNTYSNYGTLCSDKLQIVGVCEPKESARKKFTEKFSSIKSDCVFNDWESCAATNKKLADAVFITTLDQMHKEPAIAFAKLGYNILLEKPMATTHEDCVQINQACQENNVVLAVCHVLRYLPAFQTIQKMIADGVIGDVQNIQHLEPVGYYHFAHSYVRGNWHKESESTFSLLAKCCHDLDLLLWWMGDRTCLAVSSFGTLQHFKASNAPKGATADRCVDCPAEVEGACPYSAKKIYGPDKKWGKDIEDLEDFLKTSNYGKCVYKMDNDVCDNQVVSMQFDNGATATLSMVGCTEKFCTRSVRIFGSKGQITCDDMETVTHFDFNTRKTTVTKPEIDVPEEIKAKGGHHHADWLCVESFIKAVESKSPALTSPEVSLHAHFLAMHAEDARLQQTTINVASKWVIGGAEVTKHEKPKHMAAFKPSDKPAHHFEHPDETKLKDQRQEQMVWEDDDED